MNGTNIEDLPEFDNHKLVSFIHDPKTGLKGFIAIHRGGLNNPALGATRLWEYESETDALRDALRLSKLMSYKSALAGLKYGGAKAALMIPKGGIKNRKEFFNAYAQRINFLSGRFVTGTDVGVEDEDVREMRRETPYVIGAKVDPAYYTAIGVYNGIQAALKEKFGSEKISGRSFAIQGIGKVGMDVLKLLYKDTHKIFIADIDEKRAKLAKKLYPKVKIVPPLAIHKQEVDVFAPCALSRVKDGHRAPMLNRRWLL
jgi:leucine dehydrogenase